MTTTSGILQPTGERARRQRRTVRKVEGRVGFCGFRRGTVRAQIDRHLVVECYCVPVLGSPATAIDVETRIPLFVEVDYTPGK